MTFGCAVHAQQIAACIQGQVRALWAVRSAPVCCRVRGTVGEEKGRLKSLSSDSHLSRRASGSWIRGTWCSAAVVAAAKAVVAAWVEEQHRTRQPQPVCPGPGCSARAQRAQESGQLRLRFKLESRRVGTVALAASATPFRAPRRRERKGVSVDHWPPRTARAATAKPFRPLKTKPLLKMTPHA